MISESAHIHPSAKIADNVSIGPFSVIGPKVEIGENNIIGSHVVIQGDTKIGENNRFFQFASIGDLPQHKGSAECDTKLVIGNGNSFRECCTVHRGSLVGSGVTTIGNDNLFMVYSHIGHDAIIHNDTILTNNASIGGHCTIHDFAIIGANCALHQFTQVGAHAMLTGGTLVNKDVLPYVMIFSQIGQVRGLNKVGLKRRGFSYDTIRQLTEAYHIIFDKGLTIKDALSELEALVKDCPEVQLFIDGINNSTRGILRHRKMTESELEQE